MLQESDLANCLVQIQCSVVAMITVVTIIVIICCKMNSFSIYDELLHHIEGKKIVHEMYTVSIRFCDHEVICVLAFAAAFLAHKVDLLKAYSSPKTGPPL